MIELALSALLTCEGAQHIIDNIIVSESVSPAIKADLMAEIIDNSPKECWDDHADF